MLQLAHVHPTTIGQFFLNLGEDSTTTSIINPLMGESVKIDLFAVARVFNLPSEGPDPETVGSTTTAKFAKFTTYTTVEWVTGLNPLRQYLAPPFNLFTEIYTKMMANRVGTHTGVTEAKIRALSAMIDANENRQSYNWEGWFVKQLQQIGK